MLAEGWNPGWGQGEKVTYLKAYPDFDINDVCQYAAQKGVRFIGHMESWGNAQLIENEMDSAFAWFNRLGIRAVKTGYVGHLLDGKELVCSGPGNEGSVRDFYDALRKGGKPPVNDRSVGDLIYFATAEP